MIFQEGLQKSTFQPAVACSKLTVETDECVKYIQS